MHLEKIPLADGRIQPHTPDRRRFRHDRNLLCTLVVLFILTACATPPTSVEPPPAPPPEPVREPKPEVATPPPETAEPVREIPSQPEPAKLQPEPVAPPPEPVESPPEPDHFEPAPEAVAEQPPTEELPRLEESPASPVTEPERDDPPAKPSSTGGRLAGRVRILRDGREQALASTHLSRTVAAWLPDQEIDFEPMKERQIVTRQRLFFPGHLVVTSGTSIRFPNMDPIDHNVFSLTPGHRFDVGRYGEGEGRTHVFEGSGTVEILCNLHSDMKAHLLVLASPFFTTPDGDGRFVLDNLPHGSGDLLVWNHSAAKPVQRLRLDTSGIGEDLVLEVNISSTTADRRRIR